MNKSELIDALSEETGFSKKDISKVLDAYARTIRRKLNQGEKVSITGFGTFSASARPARIGINPVTKERINISATVVPHFKAGKQLKEGVKSRAQG